MKLRESCQESTRSYPGGKCKMISIQSSGGSRSQPFNIKPSTLPFKQKAGSGWTSAEQQDECLSIQTLPQLTPPQSSLPQASSITPRCRKVGPAFSLLFLSELLQLHLLTNTSIPRCELLSVRGRACSFAAPQ